MNKYRVFVVAEYSGGRPRHAELCCAATHREIHTAERCAAKMLRRLIPGAGDPLGIPVPYKIRLYHSRPDGTFERSEWSA